jgi:hypothetical protein
MGFPFRRSHLFSRTTRHNQAREQEEVKAAAGRLLEQYYPTPEQARQRAERERRQFIEENYEAIQAAERLKAAELARQQGISEPTPPNTQHCAPDKYDLLTNVGIGAAFGAAAGSAVGPIGTAVGGAFGASGAACSQMYSDHKQIKQCLNEDMQTYQKQQAEYEAHLAQLNPNYGASKEMLFSQPSFDRGHSAFENFASSKGNIQPTGSLYSNGRTHGIKIGFKF